MGQTEVTAAPSFAIAQGLPDDFLITLERTWLHCGGECPAYTVSVDAQGSVTYDGNMYVRVVGPATDRISTSHVRALAGSVDQIGFFKLNNRYTEFRNPDGTTFVVDHSHKTWSNRGLAGGAGEEAAVSRSTCRRGAGRQAGRRG